MIRHLAACVLALLVLSVPAARAADCSALTTGIDRDNLVYYVQDGARADAIAAAWYELEGRLGRAADWLKLSTFRETNAAEAIVNARKIAEFALGETARLRAELKEMPDHGPSFPPVFYWPEGWRRLAFAVLDSLDLQARYLQAEADALVAEDMAEVARIAQARNQDLSGFDRYFAAFDRQMVDLLPENHPEHMLMAMRVHWHGLFDLYAAREARTGEEEVRAASLKIVEKLNQLAKEIEADIPRFEATLAGHGDRLTPFLLTLSCDDAAAGKAREQYMATYRAFLPLVRETVELLRDYARIEVDFMNNGPSTELYDRYDAVAFRYEEVVRKGSKQWSERARILADLIARE